MLSNNFNMKDLVVADLILRIKITRKLDGISLSQSHYVNKMIERFKEYEIIEDTIFFSRIHLHKNTEIEKRQLEYSQIIGSLMNLTRSDIAFVISKLSRYTSNLSDDHWTTLLWVVDYAFNTKKYALRYEQYPLYLKGTTTQIELQILRNRNQLADTYLLLETRWYHENPPNKLHSPFHNGVRIYSLR